MKKRSRFLIILALVLMLPVSMMNVKAVSKEEGNATMQRPVGPCDIYAAAGFPCVTAHSTTRALYSSYEGPLYQVMRESDGRTLDIGMLGTGSSAGRYADAAAQDAFCNNTLCLITIIYDQSGLNNHLVQAPPGTFVGPAKGGFNTLPIADMAPITIDGYKAYGVYIMPGMGLRNNDAVGLAINDEPQGVYMVFDGFHYDSGCCFNYGNTSTNSRAVGRGTMETVYFGTSTAWGSGSGPGPWIMSDMEAGLFSGYDAKQNAATPTIDSWRFVTGVVNGGGENLWDLRGGNAQEGDLETYYSGIRPASLTNSNYYPMHRKGAIQMGNGGDNGNGSAGTFYEGVVTTGYPTDAAINAVQANIVAVRYDVQRVGLSRSTTFTGNSSQEITGTFTNTTRAPATEVRLSITVPEGWTSVVSGTSETSKLITSPVAPGVSVSAAFKVTAPEKPGAGYMTGKAEWKNQATGRIQSETTAQRVRNVLPVKINEIRFNTSTNPTDQFIELYNNSNSTVDISNWTLINTRSEWAPVKAATIPDGTKLASGSFYLLGLSGSGLAAPAAKGATTINVRSTTGFEVGHKINIGGETHTIASIGTAASAMTTLFVPVSTGPWLTIPAGSTNLPVTSAAGFEVGQKIGIDIGGNFELATVTAVGTAATQTILAAPASAGQTNIKVADNSSMRVGDTLTMNTGGRKELVRVVKIGSTGADGTGIDLAAPLRFNHILDVDVSGVGTGISFSPATRFPHMSGDAVQGLGSGITLDSPLANSHEYGTAVVNPLATGVGYQGQPAPNQWYGGPFSSSAGSIALMDPSGEIVVDAIVYGSQQSNSSANGTITSPEIATLEGDQSQGGCIMVVPRAPGSTGISWGRFPDGLDTDSNCADFLIQSASSLSSPAASGTNNIKVASVADFSVGQKIFIDEGAKSETAVISIIGTTGGTEVSTATMAGATVLPVASVAGFSAGQTITIDNGANLETAVIASITAARGRPGTQAYNPANSITVTMPLTKGHVAGVQVSGSGITLAAPLTRDHDGGARIANNVPTPGGPNQYIR